MYKKFRETFNLPESTTLLKTALEEAILKKYGSIQYFYHKEWKEITDYNEEIKHVERYTCGTDFQWEDNKISTDWHSEYKSPEEALMGLLIEHKNKFKKLVKEVYNVE